MSEIIELRKEVEDIKKRNKRVEADKAWETSWTRRLSVALLTYILIALFMVLIGVDTPFTSAIIPTIGYLLSTFSIGLVKNWWIEKRKN